MFDDAARSCAPPWSAAAPTRQAGTWPTSRISRLRTRPTRTTASLGEQQQQQASSSPPQQQYAPPPQAAPAAGPSVADQLQQIADLHQQGVLSDDEFTAAKAKILGGG